MKSRVSYTECAKSAPRISPIKAEKTCGTMQNVSYVKRDQQNKRGEGKKKAKLRVGYKIARKIRASARGGSRRAGVCVRGTNNDVVLLLYYLFICQ
ncbi:hypothetical protein EVAR_15777_1 [Eumeta japonica]|uniref:Uncharacterized protein n=1 Tax=Eumeta variegata TaxID=151549 RepID=A0A4C1TZF5_EUMVA|nr:hypothetical protein EVAR_15777_1 [Eumeta japonica]